MKTKQYGSNSIKVQFTFSFKIRVNLSIIRSLPIYGVTELREVLFLKKCRLNGPGPWCGLTVQWWTRYYVVDTQLALLSLGSHTHVHLLRFCVASQIRMSSVSPKDNTPRLDGSKLATVLVETVLYGESYLQSGMEFGSIHITLHFRRVFCSLHPSLRSLV
jgi:hypothetical protein